MPISEETSVEYPCCVRINVAGSLGFSSLTVLLRSMGFHNAVFENT